MILDLPVVLDYGPAYEDYNNRIIKTLQEMAANGRKRATIKLSRPDLNKIPLKGLRNLSGIIVWQKTHDPWTVMHHMGHKKTQYNTT